jgi:hypothetical protein
MPDERFVLGVDGLIEALRGLRYRLVRRLSLGGLLVEELTTLGGRGWDWTV